MSWRLAQSLIVLRDQIDAMYPNRDRRTDGALSGYPGAISGHNPNSAGVVCAFDITTGDYAGGITLEQSYPLADAIRQELLVAPRGLYTYVIHHMEPPYVPTPGPYIAHGGPASLWQWIPYVGDPHTSHIHVSVDADIAAGGAATGQDPYDMTDPWNISGITSQSNTIQEILVDAATEAAIAVKTLTMNIQRYAQDGSTKDGKTSVAAVMGQFNQTMERVIDKLDQVLAHQQANDSLTHAKINELTANLRAVGAAIASHNTPTP